MLKFYEIEGRFPAYREVVPQAAVGYLGSLVKVEPVLFTKYSSMREAVAGAARCHRHS